MEYTFKLKRKLKTDWVCYLMEIFKNEQEQNTMAAIV